MDDLERLARAARDCLPSHPAYQRFAKAADPTTVLGLIERSREQLWRAYCATMYLRGYGREVYWHKSAKDDETLRAMGMGYDVATSTVAEDIILPMLAALGDAKAKAMLAEDGMPLPEGPR